MFALRRNISWRPLRRRLCAGLTLVAYLLTALGVPLPAGARKDGDVPFPCQDHPCGCQTAEQCWRACCCFSPEERLAWARAHHVQPPDYAERPSGHGWRTPRQRDLDQGRAEPHDNCPNCAPQGNRPSAKETRQPCAQAPKPRGGDRQKPDSCCRTKPGKTTTCQAPPSAPGHDCQATAKRPVRWGLGVAALRCQGFSTQWAATGAVVPPAPPLTWSPSLTPAGWLSHPATLPLLLAVCPPDPPPRSLCA